MVPKKDLYQMTFLNRLKTLKFKFITNSCFTHLWLKKWGIENDYIYPYISDEFLSLDLKELQKEKVILSVGRFFKHLHAKRQETVINMFKKIKHNNPLFKDFKLILAGGLKDEDKGYFNQLKKTIGTDRSIILKPNLNFNELYKLYKLSSFYWHFTGFGVDEDEHPESVEHLGITPLEAMADGCLTFCYKAGGPKELIKDGENGFLFSDEKELMKKMCLVVENSNLRYKIISNGQKYVSENFNYQVFKKRVKEVLGC
jgi:glycosyltransferase involved in cell wall biosynthesis